MATASYTSHASTEGHELINKMLSQVGKVNYQGSFVYIHNGKLDSMNIIHGVIDGEIKEKLVSLNGEPRKVVRDHEETTCVWPLRKLVTVDPSSSYHSIPTIVPKELGSFEEFYNVIPRGVNRVAGQYCQMLDIKPIDNFRYGYKLCIQPDTGMLLRAKMIHPRGRVLEEVMFTELDYLDTVSEDLFELDIDTTEFALRKSTYTDISSNSGIKNPWRFSNLPPGFSVSKISQSHMPTSNEPVKHMVLSDGVATVSVFIMKPRSPNQIREGISHRGSINAFSKGFEDHQITVLGEVPDETVKLIGSSIEQKD
ncbi:MAG: MucB/RseB C-terminal domain-containing protein [Pseudomonadota bacterium]